MKAKINVVLYNILPIKYKKFNIQLTISYIIHPS